MIDPEIRKLRFLKMLDLKVRGYTNKEICEEFHLSQKTVERTLTWGKRAGLIIKEQDIFIEELVPLARKALKKKLQKEIEEGNADFALELYKKSGAMVESGSKTAPGAADPNAELAAHIARMRGMADSQEQLSESTATRLLESEFADEHREFGQIAGALGEPTEASGGSESSVDAISAEGHPEESQETSRTTDGEDFPPQ